MPHVQSDTRVKKQCLTWRGAGWFFVAVFLVAASGALQGEEIPFVPIKSPKEALVIGMGGNPRTLLRFVVGPAFSTGYASPDYPGGMCLQFWRKAVTSQNRRHVS